MEAGLSMRNGCESNLISLHTRQARQVRFRVGNTVVLGQLLLYADLDLLGGL
jgi:hypothetical protein